MSGGQHRTDAVKMGRARLDIIESEPQRNQEQRETAHPLCRGISVLANQKQTPQNPLTRPASLEMSENRDTTSYLKLRLFTIMPVAVEKLRFHRN